MTKNETIKNLIATKGITKAKVAERCGVHVSSLSKFLAGKPEIGDERADKIIAYLTAVNTNDVEV